MTGRLIDASPAGMSVDAMALADSRALLASGTEDGEISIRPG